MERKEQEAPNNETTENQREHAPTEPSEPAEEPKPITVADTVLLGRDLRTALKPGIRQLKPKKPLPKPAKPWVCQVYGENRGEADYVKSAKSVKSRVSTGIKKPKTKLRIRCLHKISAGCSERITFMAKPQPRLVAATLEDYGHYLPYYKVQRLQNLAIGETHFVPAQAYDHFVHARYAARLARRIRKKKACQAKKEVMGKDHCSWTRNAVVVFARSIQKRLLQPTQYRLSGGMLRLSNIILEELCCYMHMRTPTCCDTRPKSRFMISVADSVVAWIDQILVDANRRIVLVDVEDDDDVFEPSPCVEFPRPELPPPEEPVSEGAQAASADTSPEAKKT